jgi:hypothetical protein
MNGKSAAGKCRWGNTDGEDSPFLPSQADQTTFQPDDTSETRISVTSQAVGMQRVMTLSSFIVCAECQMTFILIMTPDSDGSPAGGWLTAPCWRLDRVCPTRLPTGNINRGRKLAQDAVPSMDASASDIPSVSRFRFDIPLSWETMTPTTIQPVLRGTRSHCHQRQINRQPKHQCLPKTVLVFESTMRHP